MLYTSTKYIRKPLVISFKSFYKKIIILHGCIPKNHAKFGYHDLMKHEYSQALHMEKYTWYFFNWIRALWWLSRLFSDINSMFFPAHNSETPKCFRNSAKFLPIEWFKFHNFHLGILGTQSFPLYHYLDYKNHSKNYN